MEPVGPPRNRHRTARPELDQPPAGAAGYADRCAAPYRSTTHASFSAALRHARSPDADGVLGHRLLFNRLYHAAGGACWHASSSLSPAPPSGTGFGGTPLGIRGPAVARIGHGRGYRHYLRYRLGTPCGHRRWRVRADRIWFVLAGAAAGLSFQQLPFDIYARSARTTSTSVVKQQFHGGPRPMFVVRLPGYPAAVFPAPLRSTSWTARRIPNKSNSTRPGWTEPLVISLPSKAFASTTPMTRSPPVSGAPRCWRIFTPAR